jgi:hypothetical protein
VELFIDVRTDLVPQLEFASVRTELFASVPTAELEAGADRRTERTVVRDEVFIDGVRMAEFEGLGTGVHHVRVRLLDGVGLPVIQALATVTLRETAIYTSVHRGDARVLRHAELRLRHGVRAFRPVRASSLRRGGLSRRG